LKQTLGQGDHVRFSATCSDFDGSNFGNGWTELGFCDHFAKTIFFEIYDHISKAKSEIQNIAWI
jgi:hypothetical protein